MTNSSSKRVEDELRAWVATASSGSQLPSTRALVAEHGVSPVTIQKALRALVAQGLVEARPGVGTFVRKVRTAQPHDYGWQTAALGSQPSRMPQSTAALRPASNQAIAFHAGYPDRELLPERLVRSAFTRAARSSTSLRRPPAAGLPDLQEWFAAALGAAMLPGLAPPVASDVVVLPGSQSGLSSVFRSLAGAQRPVLIESPTYWGAILAGEQVGVQLIPIPSGIHGPDPDELDRAFAETGARVFYAQPNFANPTGGQWSPDVADRVLDIVRHHGAFLVEDDWAHDFGIAADSNPLAARDDTGHVVYLRSLTKSVSPSVRVAGLIARGPARERILSDVQAQAMYVSGVLQQAAFDVVTQPAWRSHLRGVRQQLAARRDLLIDSLREHAPTTHLEGIPRGGLNLWLRLPDDTDLGRLSRECEAQDVLIASGDEWFPAEPTGRYLRLNYSGPNPGAYPDGARVIGQALA